MPIEITIPRLGWSMEEANFISWLKKEGETVKSGEPLFSMESEKAAQDIEAVDTGILRIPPTGPKAGDVVKVGQVIGYLHAKDEALENVTIGCNVSSVSELDARKVKLEAEANIIKQDSPAQNKDLSQTRKIPAISPRARRRAAELGVDPTRLIGSGRTGRIIEADVLKNHKPIAVSGLSSMRRTIAQRTAASFASAPHFYLRGELDATALIRLREDLLPEIESSAGVRLTLTDLILRAQALALKSFPAANAIWVNHDIIRLPKFDVGLVVGCVDGLMIPIVRSPDAGNLASVAKQRAALVESARANNLALEALQGGATALSNLGNSRVDEFAAVIARPHSSMLAVGRAAPRPYVLNGKPAVRTTMRLCLSVDHRVLDGGPAAEFLGLIVQLLEAPDKLV